VPKIEELIDEMRNSPRGIRYADACRIANAFFGKPRQYGTSHRVWRMPWPGDPRVNLQEGESGKAKAYQVAQLLKAIDRLRIERTAKGEVKTAAAHEKKRTRAKRR